MLALLFRTLHNLFLGSGVTKLVNNLADGTAKNSVLGMVSLYKEVIKDLQKKLPLGRCSIEVSDMSESQEPKIT